MSPQAPQQNPDLSNLQSRHLRLGWWALLVFLTLGLILEALNGFKVSWYLNVSSETRRLMWTLAHAHGTLLSVLNIVWGLAVSHCYSGTPSSRVHRASACLLAATLLLPGGFFLGGALTYGGDPGFGIALVPFGGLCLVLAILSTARATSALIRAEPAQEP